MKIKKRIRKIFFSLFFAVIPFILSSCSAPATTINTISIWEKYNTLGSYIDDNPSEGLKWISQRELSLRFLISPQENKYSYEFGTAWIYAKDNENPFTYYLATNIHVISNLNKMNNDTDRYQESDWGSVSKLQNYNFVSLSFNFVSDDKVSSLIKDSNGEIDYLYEYYYKPNENYKDPYIYLHSENNKAIKPEIVYTATGSDLLKNMNESSEFINPYTKQIIKNPAIDFAIIKIDFSSVLEDTNQSGTTVKQFLETYDKNPTFFSKNPTVDFNNNFYLAGFPEDYQIWKPNRNVAWLGLNDIKLNQDNNFISLNYNSQTSKYADFSNPKGPMPSSSSISYVKEETKNDVFLWYRNVANQLIVGGGSLGGGASGSMLISQKNNQFYVVGIYWGAYEFVTRNGIEYAYGAVDLLKTDSYYIDVENRGITIRYNFPKYDITKSAGIAVQEI